VRDGVEYLTPRELARRRGILRNAAYKWAGRHPHLCITVKGRLYVRDEENRSTNHPPVRWVGSIPYFSMTELARRRGIGAPAAAEWAKRRPHLAMKVNGFWFARDEEWEPKDGRQTPLRIKVLPPWVRSNLARQRRP
jgi:hypothetical protein